MIWLLLSIVVLLSSISFLLYRIYDLLLTLIPEQD
jgi:hypothetical protein